MEDEEDDDGEDDADDGCDRRPPDVVHAKEAHFQDWSDILVVVLLCRRRTSTTIGSTGSIHGHILLLVLGTHTAVL